MADYLDKYEEERRRRIKNRGDDPDAYPALRKATDVLTDEFFKNLREGKEAKKKRGNKKPPKLPHPPRKRPRVKSPPKAPDPQESVADTNQPIPEEQMDPDLKLAVDLIDALDEKMDTISKSSMGVFTRIFRIIAADMQKSRIELQTLKSIQENQPEILDNIRQLMQEQLDLTRKQTDEIKKKDEEARRAKEQDTEEKEEKSRKGKSEPIFKEKRPRRTMMDDAKLIGNVLGGLGSFILDPTSLTSGPLKYKLMGTVGNLFGGILGLIDKVAPMLLIAVGVGSIVKDAISGWLKSEEMNVDKVSAAIGNALAGGGMLGASLKGAGAGAAAGLAIGAVGGPIGWFAGALVGGILGAVMGAMGPEKISNWVDKTKISLEKYADQFLGTSFFYDNPERQKEIQDRYKKKSEEVKKSLDDVNKQIEAINQRIVDAQKTNNGVLLKSLDSQLKTLQGQKTDLQDTLKENNQIVASTREQRKEAMRASLKGIWEGIKTAAHVSFEAYKSWMGFLDEKGKDFNHWATVTFPQNVIQPIADLIGEWFEEKTGEWRREKWKQISETWHKLQKAIADKFNSFWSGLKDKIGTAVNFVEKVLGISLGTVSLDGSTISVDANRFEKTSPYPEIQPKPIVGPGDRIKLLQQPKINPKTRQLQQESQEKAISERQAGSRAAVTALNKSSVISNNVSNQSTTITNRASPRDESTIGSLAY